MTHKLPNLPYDYNELEPHIDTRTMGIHHGKHHQGYVNNLNAALEPHPELQSKNVVELLADLDSIPEDIRTAVRNNAGGHANHSLFWPCMSPKGGGAPTGKVAEAVDKSFGSFDSFKAEFQKAALTRFGSGWAWLCMDTAGDLLVTSTPNQDNPISTGQIPILGLDVWEHAYYLLYQNRRGDYVDGFWNVVNWNQVAANMSAVKVAAGIADAADWVGHTWASFEDAWKKYTGGSPK